MNQRNRKRSGQAMLVTVLSLGGAILGATTVAGLLTLYQIRATTDVANSAKAVFAADAGAQWALFNFYCDNIDTPSRCPVANPPWPDMSNGSNASVEVHCYNDYSGDPSAEVDCSDPSTLAAISTGIANDSERAFYVGVSTSTPTYP